MRLRTHHHELCCLFVNLIKPLCFPHRTPAPNLRSFTDKAVNLFCTTAVAVCDLVVFSVILYKIYPPLYALLLAYSLAGTAATIFFGRPLIELNGRQLKREADLRYSLVRVRENSESIAFYDGDNRSGTHPRPQETMSAARGSRKEEQTRPKP